MNNSPSHSEAPHVELHPGYWAAFDDDGQIITCCKTPEELDEEVIRRGLSPDNVVLYQVPWDDGDVFGGIELQFE